MENLVWLYNYTNVMCILFKNNVNCDIVIAILKIVLFGINLQDQTKQKIEVL